MLAGDDHPSGHAVAEMRLKFANCLGVDHLGARVVVGRGLRRQPRQVGGLLVVPRDQYCSSFLHRDASARRVRAEQFVAACDESRLG